MAAYAELQVTTNFSFLRGGSHPEELVLRAAELSQRPIAADVCRHTEPPLVELAPGHLVACHLAKADAPPHGITPRPHPRDAPPP